MNQIPARPGLPAHAPSSTFIRLDVFDRYNGVPTFGVMHERNCAYLFWMIDGYTTAHQIWLYVPLTPAEAETVDIWETLSQVGERDVTIGVAHNGKLLHGLTWTMPAGSTPESIAASLHAQGNPKPSSAPLR